MLSHSIIRQGTAGDTFGIPAENNRTSSHSPRAKSSGSATAVGRFHRGKKLGGFSPSKASDERNLTRILKRVEGVPSCDNGVRTGAAINGGSTPSHGANFNIYTKTVLVHR